MAESLPRTPKQQEPRKMNRQFWGLLVVALMLVTWGEVHRVMARSTLRQKTADEVAQIVVTVAPTRSAAGEELVLPGTVHAYSEAPIHARTNGYIKSWSVDIGSAVKRGQVLAEIDTPEIDQQLAQAIADLATARANEALANRTNTRWKALLVTESVSKQDADEKDGDADAKRAIAESAAANVSRLRQLESFKRVVAPFDGVVTMRYADTGSLVAAGTSSSSQAIPVVRIAEISKLRLVLPIPESIAAQIHTRSRDLSYRLQSLPGAGPRIRGRSNLPSIPPQLGRPRRYRSCRPMDHFETGREQKWDAEVRSRLQRLAAPFACLPQSRHAR